MNQSFLVVANTAKAKVAARVRARVRAKAKAVVVTDIARKCCFLDGISRNFHGQTSLAA
jgi:hypothetical protein